MACAPYRCSGNSASCLTTCSNTSCQDLGTDAGLGSNFRAWVCAPTSFPANRFTRDGGAYIRHGDKALITRDWADLNGGTIGAAINGTERNATFTFSATGVLTGSTQIGTSATFSGGQTNTPCVNWASTSNPNCDTRGQRGAVDSSWTNGSNTPCGTLMHGRLYCFEQ
jgi:hypothetical protein